MKLINAQRNCMEMFYSELCPNRSKNLKGEGAGEFSPTPVTKVLLLLYLFDETHKLRTASCGDLHQILPRSVQEQGHNSFILKVKCVTAPIFTKLALAQQLPVKNYYTKCHENRHSVQPLILGYGQRDRQTRSARKSFFFLCVSTTERALNIADRGKMWWVGQGKWTGE